MGTKSTIKAAGLLVLSVSTVFGDAYGTLLQRYESQIRQQERRLRSLRKNLIEKENEAKRWQQKASAAKVQWTRAGLAVERARQMVREKQQRRTKTQSLAEAAQWTVMEHLSRSKAADAEMAFWTIELYKQKATPRYFSDVNPSSVGSAPVIEQLASLSKATHVLAGKAQEKEAALRMEELRWRNEELKQTLALDRHRQQQQTVWLRWQEAIQRRKALEDERAQLEQSAQALRVMLAELRDHRNQTMAARADVPKSNAALRAMRGTLPWPAAGTVTQNFGKQYSEQLQQLVISNGIKVEADTGKSVRSVQQGKVLFARPFQEYGQLVIIQHPHGLTSVYGGLGQTQVKEGDVVATLDPVGTVGDNKSFYFELRQDEEPINPLVWLSPRGSAEVGLSTRRKYQ
jgi:septal ring factor EnvC (AmiA/AmiB activator)